MTRAYAEAPATHYRLTAETWAIIAEEYKNGATAKELGAKWKVAPSSVYRYACRDGFTKKSMGDARARAHARMVEEEEGAARALKPTGSRALAGLFAPAPVGNDQAGDPGELARAATLASGRAMHGRLWAEAKALAALAETYARLAERGDPRRGGMTVDSMPLALRLAVLLDEEVSERFSLIGSEPGRDPDHEIKQRYWECRNAQHRAEGEITDMHNRKWFKARWRAAALERQLRGLGHEPVPEPPDGHPRPRWDE